MRIPVFVNIHWLTLEVMLPLLSLTWLISNLISVINYSSFVADITSNNSRSLSDICSILNTAIKNVCPFEIHKWLFKQQNIRCCVVQFIKLYVVRRGHCIIPCIISLFDNIQNCIFVFIKSYYAEGCFRMLSNFNFKGIIFFLIIGLFK